VRQAVAKGSPAGVPSAGDGSFQQLGNGSYLLEIKDGILSSVGKKELRNQAYHAALLISGSQVRALVRPPVKSIAYLQKPISKRSA
jgi:hypothetical protein